MASCYKSFVPGFPELNGSTISSSGSIVQSFNSENRGIDITLTLTPYKTNGGKIRTKTSLTIVQHDSGDYSTVLNTQKCGIWQNEHHEPPLKSSPKSGAQEGEAVPAQIVATVVIFVFNIRQLIMNEKRARFACSLRQTEHFRGHLWHVRIPLNKSE